MKVLNIVGSLDKSAGGPSRSVPQTCVELAKLGVQIEIICRPSPAPVEVSELDNMRVRFLSFNQLRDFANKLHTRDADLIHLQHVWDPYIHIMALAARKKGIPYIITPRGMLEPWIMQHNWWKKQLGMFLYQRKDLQKASLIHTTCEMEKENIRKLGFSNPIAIIPNGINLSKVPEAKTEYGNKKMVFLSRIHPKKGIELLLDVWNQLQPKDWTLDIAGEGEKTYVASINQKIKEKNMLNVKFVGSQYGQAKWKFLKSADIFVLPTYSENFGIVVAEALAVGVPVITTTGTPWQELESYNCGWWIEPSVNNLHKALVKGMSCSSKELKEKGENGQRLIKDLYNIKAIGKAVYKLYNNTLNQNL